jgi:hypothetical protein
VHVYYGQTTDRLSDSKRPRSLDVRWTCGFSLHSASLYVVVSGISLQISLSMGSFPPLVLFLLISWHALAEGIAHAERGQGTADHHGLFSQNEDDIDSSLRKEQAFNRDAVVEPEDPLIESDVLVLDNKGERARILFPHADRIVTLNSIHFHGIEIDISRLLRDCTYMVFLYIKDGAGGVTDIIGPRIINSSSPWPFVVPHIERYGTPPSVGVTFQTKHSLITQPGIYHFRVALDRINSSGSASRALNTPTFRVHVVKESDRIHWHGTMPEHRTEVLMIGWPPEEQPVTLESLGRTGIRFKVDGLQDRWYVVLVTWNKVNYQEFMLHAHANTHFLNMAVEIETPGEYVFDAYLFLVRKGWTDMESPGHSTSYDEHYNDFDYDLSYNVHENASNMGGMRSENDHRLVIVARCSRRVLLQYGDVAQHNPNNRTEGHVTTVHGQSCPGQKAADSALHNSKSISDKYVSAEDATPLLHGTSEMASESESEPESESEMAGSHNIIQQSDYLALVRDTREEKKSRRLNAHAQCQDNTRWLTDTDTRHAQTYTWVHDPAWCARTPHTNATCSPNGFRLAGLSHENLEPNLVCAALHARGITSILVIGDSHARHLKVALCIAATGNYVNGSVHADDEALHVNCSGRRQFSERTSQCRLRVSGCCLACGEAVKVCMCVCVCVLVYLCVVLCVSILFFLFDMCALVSELSTDCS